MNSRENAQRPLLRRVNVTGIPAQAMGLMVMLAVTITAFAATTSEVTDFGSNPGNLSMFKYVPDSLRASPALVVALHGCTQSATDYDNEPGWSTLADKWGFVLLLPQQELLNNPYLCFNWFNGADPLDVGWPTDDQDRDEGDALSIKHMIDKVRADHGVDPRRIYVTGLSGGGAMSAVMLATYPEIFAGGAIIAGVPYKCTANSVEALFSCGVDFNNEGQIPIKNLSPAQWGNRVREATRYKGPWPKVSIWHGTADKTVNPKNARELVKQWTNVHGIGQTPVKDKVKGYVHEMYKDASGDVVVERYIIAGMGHGTPVDPGQGKDQCGVVGKFTPDFKICASYYIGKFWGLDKAFP
jgi:poly(hydroxyalkanoate) depolymerase family esterase